mgnify:FL=1|tara:strand:- start:645 stop:1091 length:447 start_codon:yes stop_codon:yes gene_type:complete
MVKKVKITYKGESKMVPENYVKGLKGYERTRQIKSIFEGKQRPKTSFKSKESTWTQRFNKIYGKRLDEMKGGRSKRNIAKITGIPFKAIDEVFKKGEGAYYSAGSRPNQTPQSWAYARVYSYLLGGNARKIDSEITKKYNVDFKSMKK